MNQKNRMLNIRDEMKEADEALGDAELLFKNKRFQGATARAYYAGFHMVQALLLTKGLEAKSHYGVAHLFRLHFVKAGLIDPKYSQILARAQKYREEADYRAPLKTRFLACHPREVLSGIQSANTHVDNARLDSR